MSAPTWKRHLRFRWSLLLLFTITVGAAIGTEVRSYAREKARSEFRAAVVSGNVAKVEWCLDMDPALADSGDSFDSSGVRPIHIAAMKGHPNVIKLLMERGASVNARNRNGDTPLHYAVSLGRLGAARTLLDSGARVNARGTMNCTPLHFAFEDSRYARPLANDRIALVKLLLDRGAYLEARDCSGRTPRDVAAGHSLTGLDELWDYAANKHARK